MIIMPQDERWIGYRLSSSTDFDGYADAFGGVARGQEFLIETIRVQQEYVLSMLLWENMAKSRGSNARGQHFVAHFGFVDDAVPDAFAAYRDGIHFCGLNAGLVQWAFYLANELFLLRDLVPGFGGTIADENDVSPLVLCPNSDLLQEREARGIDALYKASPKRIEARDHLAHFIVAFTIYHEFNHAISGHSEFVAARTGLARLHERGSASDDGMSSPLHQEVEYTADMGAIETMFDYVQRGAILRRLYKNAPRVPILHRLSLLALSLLCAGWHDLNRIFGSDGYHPDPAARWAACLRLYTIVLQCRYRFGRWALIARGAVRDMGAVASQCPEMLEMMTCLSAYDEHSAYWEQRDPKNNIIALDDIRDLTYPPIRAPKPYRDKRIEAMLSRAN